MKNLIISLFFAVLTSASIFGQFKIDATTTNDLRLRTNNLDRLNILVNGNVGIGNPSPAVKLEVNGDIRSSTLIGVGVRNVYANALGTLTATAQTRTVMIPPQSFQRRFNTGTGTFTASGSYGDCYISSGSTDNLIAPVILPVGATITGVTFYYTDTNTSSNLAMFLITSSALSASNNFIASLFQNTTNINAYDISSVSSGTLSDQIIDGDYYYILIIPKNTTNTADAAWGTYMSVKGVKVTYTF